MLIDQVEPIASHALAKDRADADGGEPVGRHTLYEDVAPAGERRSKMPGDMDHRRAFLELYPPSELAVRLNRFGDRVDWTLQRDCGDYDSRTADSRRDVCPGMT